MPLNGQKTKADYLEWNAVKELIYKLQRDKEYTFCLLISIGSFCGLRISDILSLTWSDIILNNQVKDTIVIVEKKTNKTRKIKINKDLRHIILNCYKNLQEKINTIESKKKIKLGKKYKKPASSLSLNIFVNKNGTVFTSQYVNQKLKIIKQFYKLPIENFSTHSLRKAFGREVWRKNDFSEKSLIVLSEIFDHSNIKITKAYLGIIEDEIDNVYDSLTF